MKKICIAIMILCFVLIPNICNAYQKIKPREIHKAVLKMFESLGKIEGYIIFYNEEGEQCVVYQPDYNKEPAGDSFDSTPTLKGYLIIQGHDGPYRFEMHKAVISLKLDINETKFSILELKNGDKIIGYPLRNILLPGDIQSMAVIKFIFHWASINAEDDCLITTGSSHE